MRHSILIAAAAALSSACGPRRTSEVAPLVFPFAVDTQRLERVAPGVAHRFVYSSTGPWAIHVLDVDRDSCYSAVAVKGFPHAAGRKPTSVMLTELDSSGTVVGGVNADFFMPNGTPTNAHISGGRVVTGSSNRPVLAFDSSGAPRIGRLRVQRTIDRGGLQDTIPWNRLMPAGIAFFDASWGASTDTASQAVEVVMRGLPAATITSIDTHVSGVTIPSDGGVLVFRGATQLDGRIFAQTSASEPIPVGQFFSPFAPVEAVGGRPVLTRDSVIVPEADTEGAAGFAASRHPRTAAGIANDGGRLLLVTVDGRQRPYSDGMTLRELATLMLALGARDAINLDGGGSTTMVVKSAVTQLLGVVNAPSDPAGERAVGNALGIVTGCVQPR